MPSNTQYLSLLAKPNKGRTNLGEEGAAPPAQTGSALPYGLPLSKASANCCTSAACPLHLPASSPGSAGSPSCPHPALRVWDLTSAAQPVSQDPTREVGHIQISWFFTICGFSKNGTTMNFGG